MPDLHPSHLDNQKNPPFKNSPPPPAYEKHFLQGQGYFLENIGHHITTSRDGPRSPFTVSPIYEAKRDKRVVFKTKSNAPTAGDGPDRHPTDLQNLPGKHLVAKGAVAQLAIRAHSPGEQPAVLEHENTEDVHN